MLTIGLGIDIGNNITRSAAKIVDSYNKDRIDNRIGRDALRDLESNQENKDQLLLCLEYAQKVREWRLKNHYGLRDFARMIDISPAHLSKIEGRFLKLPSSLTTKISPNS